MSNTSTHQRIYVSLLLLLFAAKCYAVQSGDAYIKGSDRQWTFGTAAVERTVVLEQGRFLLKSFKHKAAGKELIPQGVCSNELSFSLGEASNRINGASGGWKLVEWNTTKLSQEELQLDITLQRKSHFSVAPRTQYLASDRSVLDLKINVDLRTRNRNGTTSN